MAVCWNLIDFHAMLKKDPNDQNDQLDITKMIQNIILYRETFLKLPKEKKEQIFSDDLQANFINHICVEEGLGLQERSDTVALLKEIKQNGASPSKWQKTETRKNRTLNHSEQETKNVYDAWTYLKQLALDTNDEKDDVADSVAGLVDIDVCIRKPHRILMTQVLDKENTPAGQFSSLERQVIYRGHTHIYPKFEKEKDVEDAVQVVVDRYNALINAVKKIEDHTDRLYKMFKCAAYLLFNLITIHPFSDGNGRVCRLLCSYVLSVMFPFPSPIYNVCSSTDKSDYVDALIKARERKPSHPRELAGLLIESNWNVWKTFFDSEPKDQCSPKLQTNKYMSVP